MSAWQKLWLGPARSTSCQACGGGVGASWLSMLVVLLAPLYVFASHTVNHPAELTLFLVLFVIALLTIFVLPLRPRGRHV